VNAWTPTVLGAVLVGSLVWVGYHVTDVPGSRTAEAPSAPPPAADPGVILVVVRFKADLDTLRAAIPPNRVLLDRRDSLALTGGRIFATSIEAASEPLSRLGWAHRGLEILDPTTPRNTHNRRPSSHAADPAAASSDPFLALSKKNTLTRQDAEALLNHMLNTPP